MSVRVEQPREVYSSQQRTISGTSAVPELVEGVVAEMSARGYTREDCFAVRMGLEEALVNAIKHGHHYDPSKRVRVRFQMNSDQVLLEVADEGPGFDPSQVPDPLLPENLEKVGGRGLLLMRTFMTWVRYNDRGNCVLMCKQRSEE